jgi:integrase
MFKRGKRWYSDFVYQGERYTKAWGLISKTVAGEKDRKFRTEVLEGKHAIRAKRILFEIFCEKYLDAARLNKKPQAARRNESSIKMLKPYFQGRLIQTIAPFQVEQYKRDRKEKGAQMATINRDVACLRNMLNKAVEWGHLSHNPIASVKLFKEDNERMWVLTPEEEKKLLQECDKIQQPRKYLSDLVIFALHSGMRLREILGLRKDHVDFQGRFILVTDTKNGEARKVPINETLDGVLKWQMEDKNPSECVFCSAQGKPLTVLTNAFWQAGKNAGLTMSEVKGDRMAQVRFRFDDLRHNSKFRIIPSIPGSGAYPWLCSLPYSA